MVQTFQKRLTDRISALVADQGVTVDPKDLIREVAILADRSDISEEIVRLRAHLVQYQEILDDSESGGRKLEFVVQEMGREVNTIGSKASDVEISRNVFEIKGSSGKNPGIDPECRVISRVDGHRTAEFGHGDGQIPSARRARWRLRHSHGCRGRSCSRSTGQNFPAG